MKKIVAILFIIGSSLRVSATDGMWIPYLLAQLNEAEMREMGMELTADDIYSVNHSSIKDAIVHFGGGCTAELISSQGLLLTNHHCGYSQIQSHSSIEKDYLKNGFWAMNAQEELTNPGLTAAIVKYMKDVTNIAMEGISQSMSVAEKTDLINKNIEALIERETSSSEYEISVSSFFYGNQYILIAKEVFQDVRLVGAPPSSIGKFGADTDNWMWPRHTGDFSIFRVYASKDNKPAEVSEENVPYEPNFHLKVNTAGVQKDDFTMVFGFPGRTQEYLPASEISNTVNKYDPFRVDIRDRILNVLDAKMRVNDETRIQYASKYARISNAWKKWIGEIEGVKATKGIEKKQKLEAEFTKRINANTELKAQYSNVLPVLDSLYNSRSEVYIERYAYIEAVYYGIESMKHMLRYNRFYMLDKSEEEKIMEQAAGLASGLPGFYKNYDAALDESVMQAVFPIYLQNLKHYEGSELLRKWKSMSSVELSAAISKAYKKSIIISQAEKWTSLLEENPKKARKVLAKDPLFQLSVACHTSFIEELNPIAYHSESQIEELQALYMNALQKAFPERRFYPDANSTLRVSYGKVEGFSPVDGKEYLEQTFLDGVIAKYVPGDYEFDLPAKLLELYENKNYGIYSQDGKMPVCFIASNHTTGGNSGSPAINGKGELIGLNFDRVWEGTMSDINYDASICRNIMVDVRYVLFIVDKFAGAGYLIDEMDLVGAELLSTEE